jgi:hypothetical protein
MNFPFPLFHGTSSIFLSSIRQHGLGGKDIILEWRVLDFLRAATKILGPHIDHSDQEMQLNWKMLQAVVAQRVDHFNWRHGGTYLVADELKGVMYAASNKYGSEILTFVSWLIKEWIR